MQTPKEQGGEATAKPGKQTWVKPTVEVISMKEAMAGTNIEFGHPDGVGLGYS